MKFTPAVLFLGTLSAFAAEPRITRDIPYAQPASPRQMLDVYAPANANRRPIVFWIHGGGWVGGDKAGVKAKPALFVDHDYLFIALSYRFVPNVTIRDIMQDVAKALRWVHDNATNYGGDPDSIFVMGHSAGAQLAALICTDERYVQAEGLSLRMFKGCVPLDGDTYDVVTEVKMVESTQTKPYFDSHRRKFGHDDALQDLSAVNHVARNKGIPPFLLVHLADFPESRTGLQAQLLAEKLIHHGGVATKVLAVPGKTHNTLNDDIGAPGDAVTTDAILKFVAAQLKPSVAIKP